MILLASILREAGTQLIDFPLTYVMWLGLLYTNLFWENFSRIRTLS